MFKKMYVFDVVGTPQMVAAAAVSGWLAVHTLLVLLGWFNLSMGRSGVMSVSALAVVACLMLVVALLLSLPAIIRQVRMLRRVQEHLGDAPVRLDEGLWASADGRRWMRCRPWHRTTKWRTALDILGNSHGRLVLEQGEHYGAVPQSVEILGGLYLRSVPRLQSLEKRASCCSRRLAAQLDELRVATRCAPYGLWLNEQWQVGGQRAMYESDGAAIAAFVVVPLLGSSSSSFLADVELRHH